MSKLRSYEVNFQTTKTLSAMLKSKLRVYADNEKIRALIQKIQDQYAKAAKVLR